MGLRVVAVALVLVCAGCGSGPQGGVGFEDQTAGTTGPPSPTVDRATADPSSDQTEGTAPECDQLTDYDPAPELLVTEEPTIGEGGIPTPGPTLLALIQGGVEEVQAWAKKTAPEDFGGVWLADPTVGPLVVAFSGDVERLRTAAPDRFGDAIAVVEVRYSEAELVLVHQRLSAELGNGGPPELGTMQSVGMRTDVNRVAVGLLGPSDQMRADLATQYGDAVCVQIAAIPTAADAIPSSWLLPADADLTPDSTTIEVLVDERACHGFEPTDPERIVPPEITADDETIVVTIAVIPPTGDQTCPGVPPVPYMVDLGQPLGDRQLLDGSQTPPAPPAAQTEEPVGPPGPQPTGTVTPGITSSAAAPMPLVTDTPIPTPEPSDVLTPSALPTGG